MRAKGWFWITYHRLANRLLDLWAVLNGACNRTTWDGNTYGPGYAHWRCMRRRGHDATHRFNNYVWLDNGWGEHQPIAVNGPDDAAWISALPKWKFTRKRYMTTPMRRQRLQRRFWEEQTRQRRVAAETAEGPARHRA